MYIKKEFLNGHFSYSFYYPNGQIIADYYFRDKKNIEKILKEINSFPFDLQIEILKALIKKVPSQEEYYTALIDKCVEKKGKEGITMYHDELEKLWLETKNNEILRNFAYAIRGPPYWGTWEKVEKYFKMAEKIFPDDESTKNRLFGVYATLGNKEMVKKYCEYNGFALREKREKRNNNKK